MRHRDTQTRTQATRKHTGGYQKWICASPNMCLQRLKTSYCRCVFGMCENECDWLSYSAGFRRCVCATHTSTHMVMTHKNIWQFMHVKHMTIYVCTHINSSLFEQLLVKDPSQRLSLDKVLEHPWIIKGLEAASQTTSAGAQIWVRGGP